LNRRVLIVTPFFAPQSHAAVFRAYKLAKYLPQLGWTPHIVTVDTNYAYNEDDSLLAALPSEVQVHRARYVEPSPRGVGFASGLNDRRFNTLKRAGYFAKAAVVAPLPAKPPSASWLDTAKRTVRQAFKIPDAYWPWLLPAARLAMQVSQQHDIPLVMTSADPFTSHAIGLWLQRRGLRWVADLRDPHTHVHYQSARSPFTFAIQREIERAAAVHADAVTVAARSIALILYENYGLDDDSRLHFIPTGLDPELVSAAPAKTADDPYVIFVGEFLPDYGDAFFRYFAAALQDPRVRGRRYRVRIVGRREVNEPRIMPHLVRYGLTAHVDFVDHVSQQQLYPMIQAAEFAVLCFGESARWWCLPAKLVDYQALRKPVLAIVPNPSEARARLTETRLGVFLDGPGAVSSLTDALVAGGADFPGDDRECERYGVMAQVSAFARVFESLGR
jgi:hypothetical protein